MFKVNRLTRGSKLIAEQLVTIPERPGVYRMLNKEQKVLYVGKAKNLKKRLQSYTMANRLTLRLQIMVAETAAIEVITTETEVQALLLEASLIKSLQPRFNILLRDDTSYPYIYIDERHEYPRISKYRGTTRDQKTLFGPFAGAKSVDETIDELQKIFLLRPCTNSFFDSRLKPCLQYQIKRCSAPCVAKINIADYQLSVQQAKDFLAGRSTKVQETLITTMQNASENLEYEKAASIRDKIKLLSQIQAKNMFSLEDIEEADFIALYFEQGQCCIQVFFVRNGKNYGNKPIYLTQTEDYAEETMLEMFLGQFYQEHPIPHTIYIADFPNNKKNILEALSILAKHKVTLSTPKSKNLREVMEFVRENAEQALKRKLKEREKQDEFLLQIKGIFGLSKIPQRIEIYDNSHIQGSDAVGCMVVYGPLGFIKGQYRRFNIRLPAPEFGGDDYAMLREVLVRRLSRLKKEHPVYQEGVYPDLLLIDGGKGHLQVAEGVEKELNLAIPIVCIAKGPERNAGREHFFMVGKQPFPLPMKDPVLYKLQELRDEAHRFAIMTHRAKRGKTVDKSVLEAIENIGQKRKKLLLNFFGSVKAIENTTIDDLTKIKGISKKTAQNIYDHLHRKK